MKGGSNTSSISAPDHIEKCRVFDVKPLRSLKPVFVGANGAPSVVQGPDSGSFPPGFHSLYPFGTPQAQAFQATSSTDLNETKHTPASYVLPIRSLKTPMISPMDSETGADPPKVSTSLKKKVKKRLVRDSTASVADGIENSTGNFFDSGISITDQENGDTDTVINVLMKFDAVRRRITQVGDANHATQKAAGNLISRGVRTNMKKRVGTVPGVAVGDIFYFRGEMFLVGLHLQPMAGIDYMIIKDDVDGEEEPIATSIVSSGHYEGDAEDPDILIYSGQGGNAAKNKQASDQKLEKGNLALARSLHRENAVRVIRGVRDSVNPRVKVHVYDGLFTITEYWVEKGKSGCNTFKYKLRRMPDQPPAFSVWKSVETWKEEGLASRVGLILPDLTSGAEKIPVSLVNDIDSEKGPPHFTYCPTLKYSESLKLPQPPPGCTCHNSCQTGDLNCSCVGKNGGDMPYIAHGVLVSRKPLIYECGLENKVVQEGLRVHLEVFKTENRGWGLRSWDPIRAGSFICEYAGEVKEKSKLVNEEQDGDDDDDDDYVFDTTRVFCSSKWNYEPALVDEVESEEASEDFNLPSQVIITAKNVGNVGRFMNHSCSPNVFWQTVVCENNGEAFIRIAFFALKHIPPMTELTYDYGISCSNGNDKQSFVLGKKTCLCGSKDCQASFG